MTLTARCLVLVPLVFTSLSAAADEFALSSESTTLQIKSEDLQWSGYSVTVIEAEEWEELPRWNIEDLEGLAPSLIVDSMSRSPMGAAISMRGISSRESSAAFFPAVAVKVDDVYIGTHDSQNQVLFDFDRVEIRRGPQGAFEGAPAIGGSISVYRKLPTEELTAKAVVTTGNLDRKRVAAVANIPFGALDMRFSGTLEKGSDFINNNSPDPAAAGRGENVTDRFTLTGSVLWDEVDNVSIRYTADITRDNSTVPALANISTAADLVCDPTDEVPNCATDSDGRLPETGSFATTTQDFDNSRRYDVDQHAVHIDYQWRDLRLKSITALRETSEFSAFDYDGTFSKTYSGIASQEYRQFTQEISLQGSYSERVNYSAGMFLLNNSYLRESEDFFVLPALDTAGRIVSVTPDASRKVARVQDADLISFWLHGDYAIPDRTDPEIDKWKLDAGIRWTNVDRGYEQISSRIAAGNPSPAPLRVEATASSAEAVGTLGATYFVDPEAMAYLRYSRSFRPVGFDDTANSADGIGPLGEESADGFEVGLKTEWFNDRLRLNYVGYQNTWRGKLERYPARVSTGRVESILANLAKVEVRGHELEVEAVPTSFLKLRASIAHMNADYQDYRVPDLNTGDIVSLADLVPIMAPSDVFGFSGLYTQPFQDGTLNIFAGVRFTKEYNSDPAVPAARINHFSMIDLSIDYEWREWTFRIFSRNANGKRYGTNVHRPVDGELASLAPTFTSTLPIATTAEFNEPNFSGLQIVYVPRLGN